MAGLSGKCSCRVSSDIDVAEDEGLIIIANNIPDNWPGAPDIHSYRSLDRNFIFSGEQVQLLVCLSANRHNPGITKPSENGDSEGTVSVSQAEHVNTDEHNNQSGEARVKIDSQQDESRGISDQSRLQTGQFLQRFENSHFFARIAESNETLWSERSAQEACFKLMETSKENSSETAQIPKNKNSTSLVIDRGELHSPTSGGVVRGATKCCSLLNGDLVVLLQIKVGVEFMMDPTIEILQFEKLENQQVQPPNHDHYEELLHWLLPVNNVRRPSTSPLTPRSSLRAAATKRAASISSASEIFAFGHIRSYSMSSLQLHNEEPEATTATNDKSSLVQEDKYQFSFRSFVEIGNSGYEKLLSFRGVPLPPERFSMQCGLKGVFTPVRRWRRKLELIVPLEIRCYSADCNTDDLLCLHLKNVCPAYGPDVVVFIDSISVICEEASSSGPSLSLPVTCTEAGNDYSLRNLALRRGEEHSFILKPVPLLWRHSKAPTNSKRRQPRKSTRTSLSTLLTSSIPEFKHIIDPPAVKYAVLVSCRCNYTESKLFFRHPVSWQPSTTRDLIISVASEISTRTLAYNAAQLPIQAVTLHASNMTYDDLTLTILAPTSLTSPPPPPLVAMPNLPFSPSSDDIGNTDHSFTHLCLQSRVPLGCVPSQSSVAFKLDVVPLVDGVISLDSLQIDVKEKGRTYMPKHELKIVAMPNVTPFIV